MAEVKGPGTCPHCGATLMFAGQSICHHCSRSISDPTSLFRTAVGATGFARSTTSEPSSTPAPELPAVPQLPKVPWKPEPWPISTGPASTPVSLPSPAPGLSSEPVSASRFGLNAPPPPSFQTAAATQAGRDQQAKQRARDARRSTWQGGSSSKSTVPARAASRSGAQLSTLVAIGVVAIGVVIAILASSGTTPDYSYDWPADTYSDPTYDWEATPVPTEFPVVEVTPEPTLVEPETGDPAVPTTPQSSFSAVSPLASVPQGLAGARAEHTATLLSDGRVAIIGGVSSSNSRDAVGSIELYSPKLQAFVSGGYLLEPRFSHTATLLRDGRVLVAGGMDKQGEALASAEIYDPGTRKSRPTGDLAVGRYGASAALLPDGRVLIIGGRDQNGLVDVPEVFDPNAGAFLQGPPIRGVSDPAAVVVGRDGLFVLVGLDGDQAGEVVAVYDPRTLLSGSVQVTIATGRPGRTEASSCLLADGRVLIAGGKTRDGASGQLELIDTGNYASVVDSRLRPALVTPRVRPSLTALNDGSALIVGGEDADGNPIGTIERWVPGAATATPLGTMATGRSGHTATLLQDGSVLIVGGRSSLDAYLSSAGLYVPSA